MKNWKKNAKSFTKKQYEKVYDLWAKEQLLIPARDMAKSYAEINSYAMHPKV